ncbi:hypothetical protein FISHEDRAFT_74660 [Fistulina hepatica ATCC 64428]|uniref:Uncharacterized protein n=1 Tax=Fistulina hepatica ATCC 64428 TaxID=1128425 RepID=A0A0D7A9L3_9AGAR|nr:hypothetical protein FISHEDRAFT_74660 [Fistulina hepatica ATCC 64428]
MAFRDTHENEQKVIYETKSHRNEGQERRKDRVDLPDLTTRRSIEPDSRQSWQLMERGGSRNLPTSPKIPDPTYIPGEKYYGKSSTNFQPPPPYVSYNSKPAEHKQKDGSNPPGGGDSPPPTNNGKGSNGSDPSPSQPPPPPPSSTLREGSRGSSIDPPGNGSGPPSGGGGPPGGGNGPPSGFYDPRDGQWPLGHYIPIPVIDHKLKRENLPEYDGSERPPLKVICYFSEVKQQASLGGYVPLQLAYALTTNIKRGTRLYTWFWEVLSDREHEEARNDWRMYLTMICTLYLGPQWIQDVEVEFEAQHYRQTGHEKEIPRDFVGRRLMYSRTLNDHIEPGTEAEVRRVMSKAPVE